MTDARSASIRRYAAAYDHFAEEEQLLVAEGRYDAAQEAHAIALNILRSYRAELDDPEPQESCHCAFCILAPFRRVA